MWLRAAGFGPVPTRWSAAWWTSRSSPPTRCSSGPASAAPIVNTSLELPSASAHELTQAFYGKAFGWTFTDYGPDYASTGNGVTDVGLNGQPDDALSAPLPVIRVDQLEMLQADGSAPAR